MKTLHTRLGLSSTTLHQTVREQKDLQEINGNLQQNVKQQTCKQIMSENYNITKKNIKIQVYLLWLEWATMP